MGSQLDAYELPHEQWVQELLLNWDLGRHYEFQMTPRRPEIGFCEVLELFKFFKFLNFFLKKKQNSCPIQQQATGLQHPVLLIR